MERPRKPISKSLDQATTIIATILVILCGGAAFAAVFWLFALALALPPTRSSSLGAAIGMIAVSLRLWQVRR